MSIMVKSPFHSDSMEIDPWVYGLRPAVIKNTIIELFNDKSILITGARGIGKSSLSYQLQRILNGDRTILDRCVLDIKLSKYIIIDYVCNPDDSLESIVLSIIEKIGNKIDDFEGKYKLKSSKIDISLFGVIKTSFSLEKKENHEFKTLEDCFVQIIEKFSEAYTNPHINIVIDELDQLKPEYNIAHFIKVVLERLDKERISALSFILVGQNILFDSLLAQQPAFHRLVKHFNLKCLDIDNSEYVLDACLNRANIPTSIDNEAKELLLQMSSGYPHSLQLLGHETFICMLERYVKIPKNGIRITFDDCLNGIKNALLSEGERFKRQFSTLSNTEQYYLIIMADEKVNNIPKIYSFDNINDGAAVNNIEEKKKQTIEVLQSLCNKQILIVTNSDAIFIKQENREYRFSEEIFRVYLFDKMNNKKEIDYD